MTASENTLRDDNYSLIIVFPCINYYWPRVLLGTKTDVVNGLILLLVSVVLVHFVKRIIDTFPKTHLNLKKMVTQCTCMFWFWFINVGLGLGLGLRLGLGFG